MSRIQKEIPNFFLDSRTWVPWTVRSEVRLSEWNSKEKHFFLWNSRTGVPSTFRSRVRISERNTKEKHLFLFVLPSGSTYAKSSKYHKFLLAFYGIFRKLSYLYHPEFRRFFIYCKIQKRAESRSFPDCYLFYLGKRPTSWYSIKAQIKTSCSIKKHL